MSHTFEQRRRSGRKKINKPALIHINGADYTVLVLDLSRDGAMLLMTSELNNIQRFPLKIEGFEENTLYARVIRWVDSQMKGVWLIGVQFQNEIYSSNPISKHYRLDEVF